MKNKYKGWKRHRPDKDKGVRFVEYMLSKYHYCSRHRFGLHPQFYPFFYQFEFYFDFSILPYYQMRRHGACHVLNPIEIHNHMFETNSFMANIQISCNN